MKSTNDYKVIIEPFTERHFIKSFEKKYKNAWNITLNVIKTEFEKVDLLFIKSVAETIISHGDIRICKTEFKIAGTNESRHGSGNRCIIAIDTKKLEVHLLLIYNKTNLHSTNETAEWRKNIKDNYPEYKNIL
jgi:hypothetical protein